jgi:hypothetical protein
MHPARRPRRRRDTATTDGVREVCELQVHHPVPPPRRSIESKPAGEAHRFEDITEDLALLVVFGPAYGSRG